MVSVLGVISFSKVRGVSRGSSSHEDRHEQLDLVNGPQCINTRGPSVTLVRLDSNMNSYSIQIER